MNQGQNFSLLISSSYQTQSWQTLFSMKIMWKKSSVMEHFLLDWPYKYKLPSLAAQISMKLLWMKSCIVTQRVQSIFQHQFDIDFPTLLQHTYKNCLNIDNEIQHFDDRQNILTFFNTFSKLKFQHWFDIEILPAGDV